MASAIDELYLERALELARRGVGGTSPNPPVGAIVVSGGRIVGEGYHHRAGGPHAEVHALQAAGERARGATLYVSLEPCNHFGRTPPCSHAVVSAGIARTVIGCADPNPRTGGGGTAYLNAHNIETIVVADRRAEELIAPFARAVGSHRPFVSLKMAMSLDAQIASKQGRQEWLTGDEARAFVRELRIDHDAVAVGAGTVRIDNPQLTVRPPHDRLLPYTRVVFCETDSVDPSSRTFAQTPGYAKTIVVAPPGARDRFTALGDAVQPIFAGAANDTQLDLHAAMAALFEHGVTSLLCEGGPTMAGNLLREGLVDRLYWLIAPRFLRGPASVPVIAAAPVAGSRALRFSAVERLGEDVLVTGWFDV